MKDEKKKNGDSVFDDDMNFLGVYVENLSDFIGSEDDIKKFKNELSKQKPSEVAQHKFNELDRKEMYGYRKVCADLKTPTTQILVKNLDDFAWINIAKNDYRFKLYNKPKCEGELQKPEDKQKKRVKPRI